MNQTKEKARLLTVARECQSLYDKLLATGSTTIICDSDRFEIKWREEQYAHLCGWEYFRDRAKTMPGSHREFYRLLKEGYPLESFVKPTYSHMQYGRDRDSLEWTRRKAAVLPLALEVETATHVVLSAKGIIVVFFGNGTWAMGLGSDRKSKTYHPQSLLAASITDRSVRRKGSPLLPIRRFE